MADLIDVIDVVEVRGDPTSTEVQSIAFDSRSVHPGSLFCCVPGAVTDGHDHATTAVASGATSLLCERRLDLGVTEVQVAPGGVRPAMARLSAAFYDHPARSMVMIGVTGTNGKTTVTQLLRSVLDHAGMPTGAIGTLDGARTTPEAPVLQGLLAGLRDDGRRAVAMEVSSHALTQHRVDGIVFDVAAFTNLSRDHLDHHRTMEEYFAAKARLFSEEVARAAVINVDDPWGARLAALVGDRRVTAVRRSDATGIELAVGRSSFVWRGRTVSVPLSGMFNVDNALLVASMASLLGLDDDQVVEGLAAAAPVNGRMEVVTAGPPFAVVVDYAHTPAGLEVALTAARALAHGGRVICLFGCGGDRDSGKRPDMGSVASTLADLVVLTSDNPRTEDPLTIIEQVQSGIDAAVDLVVDPDRARAIRHAIELARPGDVVVLAGKGHETTQTIGDTVVPFDDRVEARSALSQVGGGAR
jgi:UDP-N-acetylmuramoyl-L-alanyl-D-glutamate--2,6-diaminopimelate ligase